jgi:predicted nucleic acid-binding protein
MAMTGGNAVFVDTNVLVHANVLSSPLYSAAQRLIQFYAQGGSVIWISRQVLREYLATLSRPQAYTSPIPIATLIADVTRFEAEFLVAEDNLVVTRNLLNLLRQVPMGGKQVHDANIVATMQAYGISHLLTHNVSDFARFSQFITIVPL